MVGNSTGSITINGITDSELAEILEIKSRHEAFVNFNPQQLQPRNNQQGKTTHYDNAIFTWNGEAAMEVVYKIMAFLLKKEQKVA